MSISERLSQAFDGSHFPSINAFKSELNDRFPHVKGRSYSSIHSYFEGVNPPLEFLEAAASVLDVPLVWLRTGEGSIERRDKGVENAMVADYGRVDVNELFFDCTSSGGLEWFRKSAGPLMLSSWWGATLSVFESCSDFHGASYEDLCVIGRWVLHTALEPFRKMAPSVGSYGSRRSLHGAFNLFFQSIAFAAPAPKKGRLVEELVFIFDIDLGWHERKRRKRGPAKPKRATKKDRS